MKVLMMFLFDSGIRSPTELMNIRVSDLYEDCKKLNIREEISKTFGRKINLMLCSDLLKEYIKNKELKENDYMFPISPSSTSEPPQSKLWGINNHPHAMQSQLT